MENNVNRRQWLFLTGAGVLQAAAQGPKPPRPPNVVLVMTDDQGYGDLSCHGNPVLKTPQIDRLYAESVRFTNFHVSPTCAPTRAALLTGRYSDATGAWHTIMGRSLLRPGEATLAETFRASGYRTGIFGKWHLGDNFPCRPQDRGFDEVLIHGGGGVWQTPDHFGNDYTGDTYLHNGAPQRYTGFCTDVWFNNAMRFMTDASRRSRPFFCYVPTNAPHGPMWAPPEYAKPYEAGAGKPDEPGFFGMIANIDDNMGRLTAFLRKQGLEENTILIFMTDNGTAAGASVFNAGMRGAKGSPYEGGHRVPFFIRWPGRGVAGGRDVSQLAAHVDLLPTLRELCGLAAPPPGLPLHGRSLAPLLLRGEAAGPAWEDRAIIVDSQRLENLVKWRQAAVMTQQWRLVNPSPDGNPAKLELYDIARDPGQKSNVAEAHRDVVARLSAAYDEWWNDVSRGSGEPVRIVLGDAAANPVRLTAHDWHGDGSEVTWNQAGIRKAPAANGYWAVQVATAGRYRFELRRWPPELKLALNAPYLDRTPNRETTPGRAINCRKARIKIGELDRDIAVTGKEQAAVFDLDLQPGNFDLQTWLYDADGSERGAYYAQVRRLR